MYVPYQHFLLLFFNCSVCLPLSIDEFSVLSSCVRHTMVLFFHSLLVVVDACREYFSSFDLELIACS